MLSLLELPYITSIYILRICILPPMRFDISLINFILTITFQALAPCGVNDFVCGRASEWISNGTELCHAAGFAVKPFYDIQGTTCYGGRSSLDAIADAWKSSKFNIPQKAGVLEDFKQWLRETSFNEKVSWAVAGLVLTAGLMFNRLGYTLTFQPDHSHLTIMYLSILLYH